MKTLLRALRALPLMVRTARRQVIPLAAALRRHLPTLALLAMLGGWAHFANATNVSIEGQFAGGGGEVNMGDHVVFKPAWSPKDGFATYVMRCQLKFAEAVLWENQDAAETLLCNRGITYPYVIHQVPGTYTLYAWARDNGGFLTREDSASRQITVRELILDLDTLTVEGQHVRLTGFAGNGATGVRVESDGKVIARATTHGSFDMRTDDLDTGSHTLKISPEYDSGSQLYWKVMATRDVEIKPEVKEIQVDWRTPVDGDTIGSTWTFSGTATENGQPYTSKGAVWVRYGDPQRWFYDLGYCDVVDGEFSCSFPVPERQRDDAEVVIALIVTAPGGEKYSKQKRQVWIKPLDLNWTETPAPGSLQGQHIPVSGTLKQDAKAVDAADAVELWWRAPGHGWQSAPQQRCDARAGKFSCMIDIGPDWSAPSVEVWLRANVAGSANIDQQRSFGFDTAPPALRLDTPVDRSTLASNEAVVTGHIEAVARNTSQTHALLEWRAADATWTALPPVAADANGDFQQVLPALPWDAHYEVRVRGENQSGVRSAFAERSFTVPTVFDNLTLAVDNTGRTPLLPGSHFAYIVSLHARGTVTNFQLALTLPDQLESAGALDYLGAEKNPRARWSVSNNLNPHWDGRANQTLVTTVGDGRPDLQGGDTIQIRVPVVVKTHGSANTMVSVIATAWGEDNALVSATPTESPPQTLHIGALDADDALVPTLRALVDGAAVTQLAPGADFSYRIVLTANAPLDAPQLRYQLPAGIRQYGAPRLSVVNTNRAKAPTAGAAVSANLPTLDPAWDGADASTLLAPGSVLEATASITIDIPLQIRAQALGTIDSRITAAAANVHGEQVASHRLGVIIDPDPPGALRLQKSVDRAAAMPGAVLTYTIQLTNISDAPLANLRVTDRAPAFTAYIDGSAICVAPLPPGLRCLAEAPPQNAPVPGLLTWRFDGQLRAGASGAVSYRVRVNR